MSQSRTYRLYRRLLKCIQKRKIMETLSLLEKLKNTQELVENSLLHHAIKFSNVIIVQHLIKQGFNVNARDEQGITPIMLAIINQNETLIEVLLKKDADVLINDSYGISSLQYVSQSSMKPSRRYRILNLLFEKVNADFKADNDKVARLLLDASDIVKHSIMIFGDVELVEIILKSGYPIDFQEPTHGHTALHLTIILSRVKNAKILIRNGANVNFLNNLGNSPIYYYVWSFECLDRNSKILKSMLRRSIKSAILIENLERLIRFGTKQTIVAVVQSGIDIAATTFSEPFLHLLIENQNDDVFDVFYELGIKFDVNSFASCGKTALVKAVLSKTLKKVKFLLNHGADPTVSNYYPTSFALAKLVLCDGDEIEVEIAENLFQHGGNAQFLYEYQTYFEVLDTYARNLMTKVFISHLALDEMLNAPHVNKETRRNTVDYYPLVRVHFDLCTRQLEEMKDIVIYGKITLFDFLTEEKEKIDTYVRNQDFVSSFNVFLKNEYYLKSWNMYCVSLKTRLTNATDKIEIEQKAAAAIRCLTGICNDAYYFIVFQIISYLKFQDLISLCKVVT